jgi:lipoate-protein ligase A
MFQLLRLKSYPILEQLLLEEKLLRSDSGNWCLINEGSTPAIVMGISGKKEEWVDCAKAAENKIPVIKRFSGGGTVVVDEDTLFITFISQKQLHNFPAYPEPIMRWTEQIYTQAFQHPGFRLRENDYVIEDRKFGGNAQYIRKDRWLHHTSFLWDFSSEKMQYLLHPKKAPSYRAGRPHEEFLCRLSEHFADKEELIERIINAIGKRFSIQKTSLEEAQSIHKHPTRQSTSLINEQSPV